MRRSGAISAAVLAALALGQLVAPGCDISDLTSGRTSSSSGSGGAGAGGSAGTGGTTASGGAPGTGGTTASGGGGNGGAPVDPHQPCGPLTGRFCDGHPQALLCVDFDETPEVPFADNGWIGDIHVRPAMPDSGLGTSVTRAEVGCNGKGAILDAAPNPTSSNDRYADFLYQSGATLPSKLTVQSDMRLGDAAGTSGYVTNQVCYIQFAMCQVLFRIAATGGGSSTVDNTPVTPTIDFQADLGTWHRYAFTLEPNGGNAFASVTVDGVSVLDATDTGCALGGATGVDFSAGFWLVPHDAIDHQARIDNIVVTSKP